MALERSDRTDISKYVRDTVQRLPPRGVKAQAIGRVLGTPQANTPPSTDSSDRLATTAFVQGLISSVQGTISGLVTGVSSVFGRSGAVVAQSGDYTAAQVTHALDLSNSGTQALSGTLNAGGLEIGGLQLPGTEIGYDQITAPVNIGASATTIIAGSAHTFDGSPVILEVYSPFVTLPSVSAAIVSFTLFDGPTQVVVLGEYESPAAAVSGEPLYISFRFTPSAGPHTYGIKATASSTTGTPKVNAGTGAVTTGFQPAFMRFTKV